MKTEVYSWRVSADLKAALEREARSQKASVAAVLDHAARDWLSKSHTETQSDEEQLRLHKAAAQCFGAFAGTNSHRSENVRQDVRQRLRKKYDR
jgi:hypothetical protein